MPKDTLFFATKNDLIPGLKVLEEINKLKYVRTGLFDNNTPIILNSYLEIQDLGINYSGKAVG